MGLIPDYPWLDNVLWPVAFGAQFIDEETNTITFDSPEMLKAYQFQACLLYTSQAPDVPRKHGLRVSVLLRVGTDLYL